VARADRETGRSRSARRVARRRRKTVRVVTVSSLMLGAISMLPPTSNLLQRQGVPVPHWHLPASMWQVAGALVIGVSITFFVVELILLRMAIATVRQPEVHDRYKALMLHWPYALLTPYTIFKTHVLPKVFFGSEERRAELPAAGSHRAASPQATRRSVAGHVEAAPAAERPDAVTREQYRSALAVVIDQIDSLTTDRDLLDLLLKEYRSLDQRVDEQSAVMGDQESLRFPRARSSNRWAESPWPPPSPPAQPPDARG
jgi:hypothetical protein